MFLQLVCCLDTAAVVKSSCHLLRPGVAWHLNAVQEDLTLKKFFTSTSGIWGFGLGRCFGRLIGSGLVWPRMFWVWLGTVGLGSGGVSCDRFDGGFVCRMEADLVLASVGGGVMA